MRLALTAPGLLVAAFVAGTFAAAIGYGDEGGCYMANPLENTGEGDWQWWPWGTRCALADGTLATEQQAATVAGTLLAVAGALVALSAAWRFRSRGWARGLAAGVVTVALAGWLTGLIQAPQSWMGAMAWGSLLAAGVDYRLTPAAERDWLRSGVAAVVAGCAAVVVAGFFVLWGWTSIGLVLSLPVAAVSGWLVERVARQLATRQPV